MDSDLPEQRRIAEAAIQPYKTSNVTVDISAHELLKGRMGLVLDQLLLILETAAANKRIDVRGVEVYGFFDPEEDTEQVVIAQNVDAEFDEAMSLWDTIGD